MAKRKPTTTGLVFLFHSMNSFNGTKYADKSSPEEFVTSYIKYNQKKKRYENANLAIGNFEAAIQLSEHLF